MTDRRTFVAEIHTLLAATDGAETPAVARLEDALTSGYAHALALEAERLRLERRLGEAARHAGSNGHADEIADLARRINSADGDLTTLRSLLATLRQRTSAARAATA